MPRQIFAILLMLWFPVQGWAALAMPICMHASSHHAVAQQDAGLAASVADKHHAHHAPESPAQTVDGQCDHCAACHLSHTPTLTPQTLVLSFVVPAQRAESCLVFYYQLFPEQPQRPPLALV